MKRFFRQLYLNTFAFYVLGGIGILFVFAFFFPWLYLLAQFAFYVYLALIALDVLLLFLTPQGIEGHRSMSEKLSNGDENPISVTLASNYSFAVKVKVVDELPKQFQARDFSIERTVPPMGQDVFLYYVRP